VDEDIEMINALCDQVMEVSESRSSLQEYLSKRMVTVAPNLTALVGELLGARLIARAGTLVNLAKHPSSTVQILGAEKALFRALKTRHNTPKYGLLFHASLITQTDLKFKGKMARMLAAKASLSARLDALGEEGGDTELGLRSRAYLENRMRQLEAGTVSCSLSSSTCFSLILEYRMPNGNLMVL
jgi:nucleolar protein 58